MDQHQGAIPSRAWGGRSWVTACCGGCCLGLVVLAIVSMLFFKWAFGTFEIPLDESAERLIEAFRNETLYEAQ